MSAFPPTATVALRRAKSTLSADAAEKVDFSAEVLVLGVLIRLRFTGSGILHPPLGGELDADEKRLLIYVIASDAKLEFEL